MGWHTRIKDSLKALKDAVALVEKGLSRDDPNAENLDEAARGLINVQTAASDMMGELYESHGPFIAKK